jgi:hypothetical protein
MQWAQSNYAGHTSGPDGILFPLKDDSLGDSCGWDRRGKELAAKVDR